MKPKRINIMGGIFIVAIAFGFLPWGNAAQVPAGRPFQELFDIVDELK